ncbi:Putative transcriptional regulator [Alloactinosynnema sp. L-07]|uniref:helix-turn-helix domain-containing protein n=1 Tax=Alloactinosynnema sp. L-07 TaxID=1653480 RepID=UPI00065EFE38|nr:helix-turn-helix transcriptional regulator [Alloactinosynnema sp. L-07]CRK59474.1 Putative transcriptional regulator [Alloactinosynnema sp. L-07]
MGAHPDHGLPVGQRIKHARERAGMTRSVLAGLVGKSAEWIKAVESGRLQMPRLPMLLRLAQALGIDDLATLTGNGLAVPVAMYAGEQHRALAEVRAALTDYHITPSAGAPNIDHLAARLAGAWKVRHASPDHRTQLGSILPSLIRDSQRAVRTTRGDERRNARRVLAGVYQLADFFVAYQPAPELLWMVADRALTEGQEADDPYVAAGGAWAMVQALRDAGRWEEAVDLATDAMVRLQPRLDSAPADWRGMCGALEAEIAYVHARRGRAGDAWAHLENADAIARRLGDGYRHVQSSFSNAVMAAHATTVGVELRRPGDALQAANRVDPDQIASVPRRARHLIEIARAHYQRGERPAVWALLNASNRTAPETIRFNGWAREMLLDLVHTPPAGMREDVRSLAAAVGLKVA